MSDLSVKLKDLEYFITLIECGSFQDAALQSNTSQPTITHAIHRIENELGIELFSRTTRKINLTPQGKNILIQAKIIFSHVQKIKEVSPIQIDKICNLGVPISLSSYLYDKLQSLSTHSNYDSIVVHEYMGNEVRRNLDSGDFSCALVYGDDSLNFYDKELIHEEQYLIAIKKNDPLANLPVLKIDDIKDRQIYFLQDSNFHNNSAITSAIISNLLSFNNKALYSFDYLRKTILHENGIALVPSITSQLDKHNEMIYLRFHCQLPLRSIYLVFKSPRQDKSQYSEVIQLLRDFFSELKSSD